MNYTIKCLLAGVIAFMWLGLSAQKVVKPKHRWKTVKREKVVVDMDRVLSDFNTYLDSIPFYSASYMKDEQDQVKVHITGLQNWKDRNAYINKQNLKGFVKAYEDSLLKYDKNTFSLVTLFLKRYEGMEIANEEACLDSAQAMVKKRLAAKESAIELLKDEIVKKPAEENDLKIDKKIIAICAGGVLLILLLTLWFWRANRRYKKSIQPKSGNNLPAVADASAAIVVRRKTTSILRKQNLDDVIDNDAYLKIDCDDFCDDSAVRRMYIKNTCIKDIYNLYAEDLRNADNPKEDGCMVLGRWVHDTELDEYYVSLEHIVLPGDDAVFSEYELNFGGKIKLKVADKLRKLRKETNLQYDLTCWVHSHPGLGVFFSNSDCNVQMQLKHPTHPNFLTAIVVDILTPEQELGIFTFKRDATLNSKNDLKKMYSLEELHKWAIESDRNSFKAEDYFNMMADAKSHTKECEGIELSNGAIIDMSMLTSEQNEELLCMVYGFVNKQIQKVEYVAMSVSKNDKSTDNELVGCFVTATHFSIPTVRKAVAAYVDRIKFVLVYSAIDGLLTSIPVVNQELCTDENYYGEQKLENLKIWTRRKR